MYLLDTNVVSELRKQRPHGGVVAWLQSIDDAQLYLSAVTLGEIQGLYAVLCGTPLPHFADAGLKG